MVTASKTCNYPIISEFVCQVRILWKPTQGRKKFLVWLCFNAVIRCQSICICMIFPFLLDEKKFSCMGNGAYCAVIFENMWMGGWSEGIFWLQIVCSRLCETITPPSSHSHLLQGAEKAPAKPLKNARGNFFSIFCPSSFFFFCNPIMTAYSPILSFHRTNVMSYNGPRTVSKNRKQDAKLFE